MVVWVGTEINGGFNEAASKKTILWSKLLIFSFSLNYDLPVVQYALVHFMRI